MTEQENKIMELVKVLRMRSTMAKVEYNSCKMLLGKSIEYNYCEETLNMLAADLKNERMQVAIYDEIIEKLLNIIT